MNNNIKLKLLLCTFLCSTRLYGMDPNEIYESDRAPKNHAPKKVFQNKDIIKDLSNFSLLDFKKTETEELLDFYLGCKKTVVYHVIKKADLETKILSIKDSGLAQHIFLLDCDALQKKYLVGLRIQKHAKDPAIGRYDYIDPMEGPMPQELISLLETNFSQYRPKEKPYFYKNNDYSSLKRDEQNHFLVHLFQLLKKNKFYLELQDCPEIQDLSQFSQLLKKIYHTEKQIPDLYDNTDLIKRKNLGAIFGNLAQFYRHLGDFTKDLSYYNEAALLYSYILSMIQVNILLKDLEGIYKPYDALNAIQDKIVSTIRGDREKARKIHDRETQYNASQKDHLKEIRKDVFVKIEEIEALRKNSKTDKYIKKTEETFTAIAGEMKHYLEKLYLEAEKIAEVLPCAYALIGLGSLALQQITPYSDLEFAILIETDNKENRLYFKNLSELVHFWVINLGETIIPTSKFGCDMSHLVKPAVNFDLGGKTPLGRIDGDKPYSLICSVDQMLTYMYNEDQKSEHIDKNLPYILQKTCFIHGKQDLFDAYESKTKEFLKGHGEERAIKMLTEGCVEIDYVNSIGEEYRTLGNLTQFKFKGGYGELYNVKEEIYRLPDRLLYNFGLIHGIDGTNSWDTLSQLGSAEKIKKSAETNLKKALTFATLLRLKTYSHYGYQKDTMDWEEKSDFSDQNKQDNFKLSYDYLQEGSPLWEYYYVTLPLAHGLEEFCKAQKNLQSEAKKAFFQNTVFYDDSVKVKRDISERLYQVESRLKYSRMLLNESESKYYEYDPNLTFYYIRHAVAHRSCGNMEKAIDFIKKAKNIATSEEELSIIYYFLGTIETMHHCDYQKSEEFYLKSIEKQSNLFAESKPIAICTYLSLGYSLVRRGKEAEGINYICNCLLQSHSMFGAHHQITILSHDLYARALYFSGKGKEALSHFGVALKGYKENFSSKDCKIGRVYWYIGNVYKDLENENEKAVKNYQKALEIWQVNLDINYSDAVCTYVDIVRAYYTLKDYINAYVYCNQGIQLLETKLDQQHHQTVKIYLLMAQISDEMRDCQNAVQYYEKAARVLKNDSNYDYPKTCPTRPKCYIDIGNVLAKYGKYDEAISNYKKALKISELDESNFKKAIEAQENLLKSGEIISSRMKANIEQDLSGIVELDKHGLTLLDLEKLVSYHCLEKILKAQEKHKEAREYDKKYQEIAERLQRTLNVGGLSIPLRTVNIGGFSFTFGSGQGL